MDLYNEYEGYDEENPDLEQEMYLRDITDEEENSEEEDGGDSSEAGSSDNEEQDDSSSIDGSDATKAKKIKSKNVKITDVYLSKQLAINIETYRDNVKFMYDGVVYIGKVIKKLRENVYVFDATIDGSGDPKKLKMFKLDKIKKAEK